MRVLVCERERERDGEQRKTYPDEVAVALMLTLGKQFPVSDLVLKNCLTKKKF